MRKRIRKKEGDIFRVPLKNKIYGYFQFIRQNDFFLSNDMIRVFDYKLTDLNKESEKGFIQTVIQSSILFFSHVQSINEGIKYDDWERVANLKIEKNFEEPIFLQRLQIDANDIDSMHWFLTKGRERKNLGMKLPKEYYDLNFMSGFPSDMMTENIELGRIKFDRVKFLLKEEK